MGGALVHQGSASCAPTKFNNFPDTSKVIRYFVLVSNSLQSFGGQYQFYYRLSLWLDHTPPRLPPGWSLTLSSLQSPDFRNFRLLGQNQSISREKLGVSWYLISFSSFWLTKNEHYLRFHWWPVCQYSLQKETFSSRFIYSCGKINTALKVTSFFSPCIVFFGLYIFFYVLYVVCVTSCIPETTPRVLI